MVDRQRIFQMLKDRGIPIHLNGFGYLLEGVALGCESPGLLHGMLTKSLYPEIAKKFNVSWQSVERCMRNAIVHSAEPEHSPGSLIKEIIWTLKVEE